MICSRGDIYWAEMGEVIGSEQGGFRPFLVIQNDVGNKFSPTVVGLAVTSQMTKAKLPTHVELKGATYGLKKDSLILAEQFKTLDKRRFKDYIGHLTEEDMSRVEKAILVSIGIDK